MIKLKSRIAIPIRNLFYLFVYFVFMEPRYFYYVSGVDQAFRLCMYLSLMLLIFLYVFFWKHRKRSKITLLVIAYHVYLIGVTVLRHGAVSDALVDSVIFIGLTILTEFVIRDNPAFLCNELLGLLIFELFINFLTIIVFPNGLYSTEYFAKNYFLGYDNQNINIMLPALILAITRFKYKMKYAGFILAVTVFLDLFMVLTFFSGASMVVMGLTLLLSLPIFCDNTRIYNSKNYLILNIGMFFTIVVFRLQNLFEFLIVDILGKNLTLTGRTMIWDRAWYFIKQNPVLGYGVEYYSSRTVKMKLPVYYPAGLHAHDRFIETIYRGGLILTVLYILILLISVKGLMVKKNSIISKTVAVGVFVYLTGMLTEFYKYSYLFFPMLLIGEMAAKVDQKLQDPKSKLGFLHYFLKIGS